MTNLKELYDNNVNIMQYFRENSENNCNTTDAILVSYDFQAGSYAKALKENKLNENYHINGEKVTMHTLDYAEKFCKYVAEVIDNFDYKTILEAGVGEATSFSSVIKNLKNQNAEFYGFDIAPSRIQQGNKFLKENDIHNAELIVADLLKTPFADNSFDIVYTIHAVEPNTNNADIILEELYRITNNFLILIEPSYELGNQATKENIEKHKYVKNLKGTVDKLGYKVLKYELTPIGTYSNQPAVMIIEKNKQAPPLRKKGYCCPICKNKLDLHKDNFYCTECFMLYPIIKNIPLLTKENAILFTQYME